METLVLIPDIQCPQHDERAIAVALQLIRDIKPTQVVFLGDVIAADSISRYGKDTWAEAKLTFEQEAAITNQVLDDFDKVFRRIKVGRIIFLEGNHETRLVRFLLQNARQLGDIDNFHIESQLRLDERGYEYVPEEQQPVKISKFFVAHGYYLNQYHAAKTTRESHRNIFYGHTHDHQVHTPGHFENDTPIMAMSCGCLCKFRQDYLKGRPTNWIHGLTIINYNRHVFTPIFLPIVKYRCIYNGKEYEG